MRSVTSNVQRAIAVSVNNGSVMLTTTAVITATKIPLSAVCRQYRATDELHSGLFCWGFYGLELAAGRST